MNSHSNILKCYLGPMDGAEVERRHVNPDGMVVRGIVQEVVDCHDKAAVNTCRVLVWKWVFGPDVGTYQVKYRLVDSGGRQILRYVGSTV